MRCKMRIYRISAPCLSPPLKRRVKLLFTEGVNSIVDLNSTSVVELKERVELEEGSGMPN